MFLWCNLQFSTARNALITSCAFSEQEGGCDSCPLPTTSPPPCKGKSTCVNIVYEHFLWADHARDTALLTYILVRNRMSLRKLGHVLQLRTKKHRENLVSGIKGGHDLESGLKQPKLCVLESPGMLLMCLFAEWTNGSRGNRRVGKEGNTESKKTGRDQQGEASTPRNASPSVLECSSLCVFLQNGLFGLGNQKGFSVRKEYVYEQGPNIIQKQ